MINESAVCEERFAATLKRSATLRESVIEDFCFCYFQPFWYFREVNRALRSL